MDKTLEQIILQDEELKKLANEVFRGKLAKTIMLVTKDGDYAFEFAKVLSCLILDGKLNDGQLEKTENYYKVNSLSHPDVKIYPKKQKLLVSDSEEIVFESAVKPVFADKKIFIIKNFEQSMEAAQNKLLKTLEEPEENVYFILTTENARQVLPTIRSRCQKIELKKLSKDQLVSYLGACEDLEEVCALSEGYIGRAEKLRELGDVKNLFLKAFSLVRDLKSSKDLVKFTPVISEFSDKSDLLLAFLGLIYEDLLFAKADKEVHLGFVKGQIMALKDEYSMKALIEVRKKIDRASEELFYNCNYTIVLENLLLNILEVKYLWK